MAPDIKNLRNIIKEMPKGDWYFYFNKVTMVIILKSIKIAYIICSLIAKMIQGIKKTDTIIMATLETSIIQQFSNGMNLTAQIRKYHE
ncbi:MAG: hypothetical protein RL553_146 [Planctomycetota bacterium]